jgi:hypothetical protein
MIEIIKDSIDRALVFFMADSVDHVTGKAGLAPAVQISKNGGAFAAPAGAITEIGAGFYKLTPDAADTDTLGILALSATAAGADHAAMAFAIVDNLVTLIHSEAVPGAYANGTAGAAIGRLNNTPPDAPVIIIPAPADDADLCTVFIDAENISNDPVANLTVKFELVSVPAKTERVLSNSVVAMVTDAEGRGVIALQRNDRIAPEGTSYRVTCEKLGWKNEPLTLTTETFNLADLIE